MIRLPALAASGLLLALAGCNEADRDMQPSTTDATGTTFDNPTRSGEARFTELAGRWGPAEDGPRCPDAAEVLRIDGSNFSIGSKRCTDGILLVDGPALKYESATCSDNSEAGYRFETESDDIIRVQGGTVDERYVRCDR